MSVRLIERTIDKRDQPLLLPDIELEGWWISLDDDEAMVIERYCDHGTHEQFHSDKFAGRVLSPISSAVCHTGCSSRCQRLGSFGKRCPNWPGT